MKKNFSAAVIISVLLVSCISSPIKSGRPSWINNSAIAGKITGVGICGTHVNGKNAQRTLAIKRAIDEIAAQLGVTVNNVALVSTVGNSSGASTSVESYSLQSVDGKVVTAVIKSTWQNFETDELYIWMVTQ